ncbi:MAG TPA: M48 family metallopeptidase [Clostridiales bacterium]|nr:M48 family metallopeptidase [Clostridiales bacterium]
MIKHISVGNVPVELERKKIKNMYLRVVPPEGQVRITAPMRMGEEEIRKFVLTKLDWIRTKQQEMENRHPQEEIDYVSGEKIYLWGNPYQLQVQEKNVRPSIQAGAGLLVLAVKPEAGKEQRKKMVDTLYREVLLKEIPPLMAKWEARIGVKATGFTVRDMKTRWGTCNVRTKKICLSLQLAKQQPRCLEYVVVHELVHLLERSHNHVFKSYLDHFLPEWRQIKKEMNGKAAI